jgi:hypothetical protein
MKLVFGLCNLMSDYLQEILGPFPPLTGAEGLAELSDDLRARIEAGIKADMALHPEAREPVMTRVDERQEGRSELVREIATPPLS